ncbi:3-hydroxyacyl-ACP dehydratase FabZ [Aerococcus urinae]|uniref:3-hydroxyacyl-ACP dehydratase FabZ n=1 Tax=Aerococcus urinae TaxID=1376 RepID=UPI0018A6EF03|nr:3-hydroxyacyl-ACP dehydratase FabZ [Aerococcus urinae]
MENQEPILSAQELMDIIPNRYPMFLVDAVYELDVGKRIVARKNVTINEPFFVGHFPGEPVMPGVLQVELMAQVGSIALLKGLNTEDKKMTGYLAAVDKVKFRQKVVPGDVLTVEVNILKMKKSIGTAKAEIRREDGKVVSSCLMTFAVGEAK